MNFALIFAGGTGSRMGSNLPKQFLKVFDKPIIIRTLEWFEQNPDIDIIVISCLEGYISYLTKLISVYGISKVRKIVPGGKTSQLSIYHGLIAAKAMSPFQRNIVLIHDGVRPLITDAIISQNIEAVRKYNSCITTGIAKETVVEIGEFPEISYVLPKKDVRIAKAPQSFWLEDILSVHESAMKDGLIDTVDSCTLMSHFGWKLYALDGPIENIKITTPDDFFSLRGILDAFENRFAEGEDSFIVNQDEDSEKISGVFQ